MMANSTENAVSTPAAVKPPKKKRKWIKRTIILLLLLGAGAFAASRLLGGRKDAAVSMGTYQETAVERRDITSELTYSGTLEPADSYTVTSLVSGEILAADFEEGDTVAKDDVLYTIDSSNAETGVERAANSLSQAQRTYDQAQRSLKDLNITAPAAGQLVSLDVELGDDVTPGQTVAQIRDSAVMSVRLPFPADEAVSFYVGQAAAVTVDGSFETLPGTVTAVSASDSVLSGGRIVRMVTIEVQNPGAITAETTATATIGASACAQNAAFEYRAEKTVTAGAAGTVASLPVAEGSPVSKDQLLISLSSDTITDQIASAGDQVRDAQLSLENQRDTLDNYTLKSPISGTIIDKTYKQGDNLETGKQLCTIFDLSYLSFTMYVDELDIKQVEVGQKVQITADAVEGQTFEGTITKVSINGTTSQGATTYPVTVRIDEMGELLPGMNVDAAVILSEAKDVLSVPVEAVSRGERVLVKTEGPEAAVEGNPEGLPVGYAYRDIEVGVSDGDYIEISSGLAEGDTVAFQPSSSGGFFMMPMGGEVSVATEGGPPEGGGPGGGPGGGR